MDSLRIRSVARRVIFEDHSVCTWPAIFFAFTLPTAYRAGLSQSCFSFATAMKSWPSHAMEKRTNEWMWKGKIAPFEHRQRRTEFKRRHKQKPKAFRSPFVHSPSTHRQKVTETKKSTASPTHSDSSLNLSISSYLFSSIITVEGRTEGLVYLLPPHRL